MDSHFKHEYTFLLLLWNSLYINIFICKKAFFFYLSCKSCKSWRHNQKCDGVQIWIHLFFLFLFVKLHRIFFLVSVSFFVVEVALLFFLHIILLLLSLKFSKPNSNYVRFVLLLLMMMNYVLFSTLHRIFLLLFF